MAEEFIAGLFTWMPCWEWSIDQIIKLWHDHTFVGRIQVIDACDSLMRRGVIEMGPGEKLYNKSYVDNFLAAEWPRSING